LTQKSNFLDKPFFLWFLANILGFGVLGLAGLVFPILMFQTNFLASTFFITFPISFTQWLALRRLGPISWLWILAFPLGLLAMVFVVRNMPDNLWPFVDDESMLTLTSIYLAGGILIGLPQWFLLQPVFPRAFLWVPATAGGLALGLAVVLGTNLIDISGIISFILAALVYTAVTGMTLSRWLVQSGSPQINLSEAI
jgi:hypothetical protein